MMLHIVPSLLAVLLSAIPVVALADGLPYPFSARCLDNETGAVFRVTDQAGAFAYNFDGGTEFTAIRSGLWMEVPVSMQAGRPPSTAMQVSVLDGTFALHYDGSRLTFGLTKLDANKINFVDEIAGGECTLIPLIPIPRNLDVGATFTGPRDDKLKAKDTF